jgi:HD-GYP domain-containing protein (c-di-GMP phosphodiesterase class II)
MDKRVPIDELTVGMEVVALDKSWHETNILFHRFKIRSEDEIKKLRENGIRMVTIHTVEGSEKRQEASEKRSDTGEGSNTSSKEAEAITPEFQTLDLTPPHALRQWTALQEKTVAVVARSFENIRQKLSFDVHPLKEQVSQTLEMTFNIPHNNSFLLTLSEVDDESYVHSANTMVLTMSLAAQAGISREEVAQWGLAALLHDIGKALIPLDVLKKPGKLTPSEWDIMKKHPQLGHSILSRSKDEVIRGLCSTVCIEHHERKNGTGYPYGIDLKELNPVSRSLMVLDIYEALTAGRVYASPLSPAKTLAYLLETEIHHLDPKAIAELIRMIGVYPVGSLVELTDGKIAMVSEYKDPDTRAGEVNLLVLFSSMAVPVAEPFHITLPLIDRKSVTKTFHPRELGISPSDIVRYLEIPGPDFSEGA